MFAASKTSAAAAGAPAPSTDPQFNYVTMLLHGDGTNGAQNNTFVDSSTNNFTITRNGTPTQGSFSPYGDLWSNYFTGTSQYLTTGTIPAFSGDFTVECWVYLNSSGQISKNFCTGNSTGNQSFSMYNSGGRLSFGAVNVAYDVFSANAIPSMQWVHVAATRSGTTLRLFINGVNDGTVTQSRTYTSGTGYVGGNPSTGTQTVDGYISNLRVVTGTALYTSAFTPSTTPLTAVSGTSLLTCQSNRFKDNSSNNFAITVTGTPSVQRFSPFDPAAEYSTSVIGGSAYIPGTTNYLSTSGAAIAVGAGAFTLEGWVYFNNVNDGGFGSLCSVVNSSTDRGVSLFLTGSGAWRFRIGRSVAGQFEDFFGTTTLIRYQWYHFKIVRTSTGTNDTRLYLNGVQQAIGTSTININFAQFAVGRVYPSEFTTALDGYIAGVRLTNTAESSAVPTAPVTAVTGTALLLNTVNAGIFDNAMMNDLVTVGNAQVSTAVKKYGTGSMAFDGSGDWLTYPDTPATRLESGDFTIEAWIYLNTVGVSQTIVTKGNITGFIFWVSGNLRFTWGTSSILIASSLSANQWYHVAVVRSGSATGNLKIYIDGVLSATSSTAVTDNFNQTDIGYVGVGRSAANPMNGYIDDLRITKGIARYTANFTPPTAAFPNL